jgi:predicted Zn-dependent peptidase
MAAAGELLARGHDAKPELRFDEDRLLFVDTVPASELPFGLWLEARRLDPGRPLDWMRARDAAIDERRARIDDVAYAPAALRLEELIHEGDWRYEHAGVGSMHDLRAANATDAAEFEARQVGPNRAALAIVGNVAPTEAFALAKRWLGAVRAASAAPVKPEAPRPSEAGPRQAIVEDAHAKLPALLEGWPIPRGDESERDAIAVAATILAGGHGSRLPRILVEEQALAVEVSAELGERRGPGQLVVRAVLASGARVDSVQRVLDAQIAELARSGPTDAEMRLARARLEARLLGRLAAPASAAAALAEAELAGDASELTAVHARRLAVGKDAVRRAVAKLLVPARRSLVEVRPGAADRERDKR